LLHLVKLFHSIEFLGIIQFELQVIQIMMKNEWKIVIHIF